MSLKTTTIFFVVTAALLLTGGCFVSTDYDSDRGIDRIVIDEIGRDKVTNRVHFKLGRLATGLAKFVVKRVDEGDEVGPFLACVKQVEVTITELRGLSNLRDLRWHERLSARYENNGWELLVRVRDGRENVLIMYKPGKEKIKEMLVVALMPTELVTVKVGGKLDDLIVVALDDQHFGKHLAESIQ
jgi:hypothetical protein